MSSFLGARGTCGLNFDLIKNHSSSSSCSSTLSKSSSVSSLPISIKRARTPRKRPNQTYMEAATLLSNACPSVFSTKNLHKKHSISLSSSSTSSLSSSEILSRLPVHKDSDFLIEVPSSHGTNTSSPSKFNSPISVVDQSSLVIIRDVSPPKAFDCDAVSIFDDNGKEGIDSIMGKLSMNDCDSNTSFNPFIGFGRSSNSIREAFRGASIDSIYGPMLKMVRIKDIVTEDYNTMLSLGKKKNIKKKTKKVKDFNSEQEEVKSNVVANSSRKLDRKMCGGLGLKLVHEEVFKAWGDQGFPFLCDSAIQESSAEIAARLAGINLSPDEEMETSGVKYGSEKCKKTCNLGKKFCYQVGKVNAECGPRVKGRFVKKKTRKLEEI